MDALYDSARRDFIVALAWALTTLWLRLRARLALPVSRLMTRPVAGAWRGRPSAKVQTTIVKLERMAERGVWRSETVVDLQRGAEAALADAELDCRRARAEFGALRDPEPTLTVRGADPMAA
jgi:hypothetical protein